MVDEYLIDRFVGSAKLVLQKPTPREVVLTADAPWEGNTSAYYTIFRDSERFRMYYRGSHFNEQTKKESHREVACYAESSDGIHWTKPDLGIVEYNGSKANNLAEVLDFGHPSLSAPRFAVPPGPFGVPCVLDPAVIAAAIAEELRYWETRWG